MYLFVSDRLLQVLCRTFIHSLWQGLVLTVLAAGVMLLGKRAGAAWRYFLLCTLFLLLLGGVAASFLGEWHANGELPALAHSLITVGGSNFPSPFAAQWIRKGTDFLNAHAQAVVQAWLIVLVFKSGKIMLDGLYLRRLRLVNVVAPDHQWTARLQALAGELRILQKVSLLESALVKVPVVIGHVKPLILIPAGLLAQLTPGEVEAVLLHELAHIRRHDFLVNFLQRLSEILFFFNPGVLWVSSLIRTERENCCDDMALACTGNKLQFVEALIHCKEYAHQTPAHALGLFGNKPLLLQRISRIVNPGNQSLSSLERVFFTLSLAILISLFSGMLTADHQPVQLLAKQVALPGIAVLPSQDAALPPLSVAKKERKTLSVKRILPKNRRVPVRASPMPATAVKQPVLKEETVATGEGLDLSHTDVQPRETESRTDQRNADAWRAMAEMDQLQARKDREQALRDRAQAELDRKQAELDRIQAARDRLQADKDREQAMLERQRFQRRQ